MELDLDIELKLPRLESEEIEQLLETLPTR